MWGVLFVVCALLPSLLCKEYAPAVGLADDEKSVLSRIVKRVGKNSFRKGSQPKRDYDEGDEAKCGNLTVNTGAIINTNESISNGGTFLEAFKGVDSNQACVDHCCKNSSCDTAVFENKDEHRCFLFRCRGNCSFSHHTGYKYISSVINRRPAAPAPQPVTLTASEAAVLGHDSEAKGDDDVKNKSISDREGSATDSGKSSESVGSKGDNALTMSAPPLAASTAPAADDTNILSHSGEECPAGSFQCQNLADGKIQCIAEEKVCDSIKQCADGSDEYRCVSSGKQEQSVTEKEGKSKEKQQSSQEQVSSSTEAGKSEKNLPYSKEKNQSSLEEEKQPSSEEKKQPSAEEKNQSSSDEKNQSPANKKNQQSVEEKNQSPANKKNQQSLEGKNQSSGEEKDQSSDEKNQSSAKEKTKEKNHSNSDKDSDDASSEGETQEKNPVDFDEKVIDSTHRAEDRPATEATPTVIPRVDFISREKVAQPPRNSNLQVPIIALSVGLAFTLILLIFVACRLCRVRRQLRKGRPLHCNEADYLINGMYL